MTITADAGDALRVIHTLNAQSALAQLGTADLIAVVRDKLEERGVPHTIWGADALRQPIRDWLGDDVTDDEAREITAKTMLTPEWRSLSEPTEEHARLIGNALWNHSRMILPA